MSRYLIQRIPYEAPRQPDELLISFTLDLPGLEEHKPKIEFLLDWIQNHPDPLPSPLSSLINLVRNFLPAPKPP